MFASSFVNVCIVWIRVLERPCLARRATRYMVLRLEKLSISIFCTSKYIGSSGPEGSEGLPDEDGFRYILVIMDNLSIFVSLKPAKACTAEVTAKHLLNWCKTIGVPRVRVSDTATHFKNRGNQKCFSAFVC